MSIFRTASTLALATALALAAGPAFSYSINNSRQIVDDSGKVVQLKGVNVFGFETGNHVMHGLWARNWKDMIVQMQGLGFNAVRLPFCPATLRSDTMPASIDYSRNADLQGLTSLQILDKVIAEFNARGMYVLLDHHTPIAPAFPSSGTPAPIPRHSGWPTCALWPTATRTCRMYSAWI